MARKHHDPEEIAAARLLVPKAGWTKENGVTIETAACVHAAMLWPGHSWIFSWSSGMP